MTSKEALERLGDACNEWTEARNIYHCEYEQIKQDLEVLELLKKRCTGAKNAYGEGTWGWVEFSLADYDEDELDYEEVQKEIEMIREWLEK